MPSRIAHSRFYHQVSIVHFNLKKRSIWKIRTGETRRWDIVCHLHFEVLWFRFPGFYCLSSDFWDLSDTINTFSSNWYCSIGLVSETDSHPFWIFSMLESVEFEPKKPSKRLDLQGIRGLAIIVVLGFHFFPDAFPNGYLGVDQWVQSIDPITTFQQTQVLRSIRLPDVHVAQKTRTKSSVLPGQPVLLQKIQKDLTSLPPCHLLLNARSLPILPWHCHRNQQTFSCPSSSFRIQQTQNKRGGLFSNGQFDLLSEQSPFLQLSIAIDIFTHTWSLSVEIQFYFLVPVMFLLASRFSQKLQYAYYFALGLLVL